MSNPFAKDGDYNCGYTRGTDSRRHYGNNGRGRRSTRPKRRQRLAHRGPNKQYSPFHSKFSKFRETTNGSVVTSANDTLWDPSGYSRRDRHYSENTSSRGEPLADWDFAGCLDSKQKSADSSEPREQPLGCTANVNQGVRNEAVDREGTETSAENTRIQQKKDGNAAKEMDEREKERKSKLGAKADQEVNKSAAKSISKKSKSSSSSSSSDSDDDTTDSDIKKLKKAVNERMIKKSEDEVNTKAEIKNKTSKTLPSSSSDLSSDSESVISAGCVKKEKKSEDEVVCLGNLERVENLVDNDEEQQPTLEIETCLFCDKKGHTSFHCFMICKNCGEKYHGFKDCPKPANLSTVLQNFMEFCLAQFYQYNPERRFTLEEGIQTSGVRNLRGELNNEIMKDARSRLKATSSIRSTPESSRMSQRRFKAYSDSSSAENLDQQKRKKYRTYKNSPISVTPPTSFPSIPVHPQFPSMFPYPFNQGISFNPQGVTVNPLLAYTQMMGYNALNLPSKEHNNM